MKKAEQLKFNIYGSPDQILSRGDGYGTTSKVEWFVRLGRGFPERLIETWGNLYADFSTVADGRDGVRFVEVAVCSNEAGGHWMKIRSFS